MGADRRKSKDLFKVMATALIFMPPPSCVVGRPLQGDQQDEAAHRTVNAMVSLQLGPRPGLSLEPWAHEETAVPLAGVVRQEISLQDPSGSKRLAQGISWVLAKTIFS